MGGDGDCRHVSATVSMIGAATGMGSDAGEDGREAPAAARGERGGVRGKLTCSFCIRLQRACAQCGARVTLGWVGRLGKSVRVKAL